MFGRWETGSSLLFNERMKQNSSPAGCERCESQTQIEHNIKRYIFVTSSAAAAKTKRTLISLRDSNGFRASQSLGAAATKP